MLRNRKFRSSLFRLGAARIGRTLAIDPQSRPQRGRRLWTAVRLGAAASVCLAFGGAMAAESIPEVCSDVDLRLTTRIEAHGEAQDVRPEVLAQAFFTVLEARRACNSGQIETAMKLYDSIPLGPSITEIGD